MKRSYISESELMKKDPLLTEALMLAVYNGHITTTQIQKHFNIGYPRAARMIDILEECNFIEGSSDKKERAVKITDAEYEKYYGFTRNDLARVFVVPKASNVVKIDKAEKLKLAEIKITDEKGKPLSKEKQDEIKAELKTFAYDPGNLVVDLDDMKEFLDSKNYCLKYKNFKMISEEVVAKETTIKDAGQMFFILETYPEAKPDDVYFDTLSNRNGLLGINADLKKGETSILTILY